MRAAVRAAEAIDRALMPRCCAFCGTGCLPGEPDLCAGCAGDLPWIDTQCAGCAEPLARPAGPGVRCADCQQKPTGITVACAPLHYRFPVDAAIKALKFRRRLDYVPALAGILAQSIERLPSDIDALLPVPLHWRRQALRGFNQAAELCGPLRRRTGWPMLHRVVRVRATRYQAELDAGARRRNIKSAFAVECAVDARHVLIVDDVLTTGSTCRELGRVLRAAGAKQVSVLAVAKASPER